MCMCIQVIVIFISHPALLVFVIVFNSISIIEKEGNVRKVRVFIAVML